MKLSRTSYVVLGLLSLGARTGYDVKALADNSARFFWAMSYGQIYPELARLEKKGLIEGVAEPSGGRRRRAYALTDAGRRALRDWLTADESPSVEIRHEGVLKLFLSDQLGPEAGVAQLERSAAEHDRLAAELEAIRPLAAQKVEQQGKRMPLATLEWGIELHRFNADWCRRAAERLRSDSDERS